MTDPALITALGGLAATFVGIVGLWIRQSRTVGSNGGQTLHQIVARIDQRQQEHGERLTAVETSIKHLTKGQP